MGHEPIVKRSDSHLGYSRQTGTRSRLAEGMTPVTRERIATLGHFCGHSGCEKIGGWGCPAWPEKTKPTDGMLSR